jgi:cytochrome c peroxidase
MIIACTQRGRDCASCALPSKNRQVRDAAQEKSHVRGDRGGGSPRRGASRPGADARRADQAAAAKLDLDARKVDLGKKLFHDKRLSKDNSLSCASCHDIAKGGVDGQQFATGIKGRSGRSTRPRC